jgi:hypothetical protein
VIGRTQILSWCAIAAAVLSLAASTRAATVGVRFAEGASHGFVRLRSPEGRILADGETLQRRQGNQVVSRLLFTFRDGSVYDETTTFTQTRQFRLISHHLVQRGPAFPDALDVKIDAASGQVVVHYTDHGEAKSAAEHIDLPPDVSNGLVQLILKNALPNSVPSELPYVIAAPKPRLVKLAVSVAGTDRVQAAGHRRNATHYVLKVELGGVAGVVAPLIGKQPPDSHLWILRSDVPAFLRAQQPFFSDAPLWTIELASPQFAPAP